MSSGGATLQGSFSGETGTISEVGFYYGTTNNPSTKVTATGTSSPFSKAITGLTPGTTYYYKAYVIEGGQERAGSVVSFTTPSLGTVTTGSASNVTSSSATLSASYSNVVTGQHAPQDIYFKYGTSSGNLDKTAYYNDGLTNTSGSFSVSVSDLDPSATYYYKVYMSVWDGTAYQEISGDVVSFNTPAAPAQTGWQAYLSDYGMPDVSGLGLSLLQSGTLSARDDKWYSVNTSNSNRQIAIHTYSQGALNNAETLSYVVLYDKSKYAPLWTYHVMNSTYWPDNNVSRNEDWVSDPAISLTQQTGLDNANSVGYSRGHLVASNYRQTTVAQNKQTFYYSNQAPQWQSGFNSGVWSTLEERVASSAVVPSGTTMLYVVTGVLYEGTTTTKPSGSLNVPIPSHFYKCIMRCTFNGSTITGAQGIAFVYTNESHTGSSYYDSAFVTTIDDIETRTGFDFFAAVPAGVQKTAEANSDHRWFTGASNLNSVYDQNWGTL